MNRITPEMVLEAYEKTGIVPDGRSYGTCAIAALCYAAGRADPQAYGRAEFGEDYAAAFGCGFDPTYKSGPLITEPFATGYADGLACAKAVFEQGDAA